MNKLNFQILEHLDLNFSYNKILDFDKLTLNIEKLDNLKILKLTYKYSNLKCLVPFY